jgi:phospho-N-acetylmuramoyl-pentapeptide-transferase
VNAWLLDALVFVGVLALTLVLAPPLIRALRRRRYGQTAYEDAPQTHAVKSGTPTMGGLLFAPALFVALAVRRDPATLALVVLGLLCGAVGVLDDVIGIRSGRNRGLPARTKFLLTAVAAVVFLAVLMSDPAFGFRGAILSVGSLHLVAPVWLWYLLSVLVVMATTHAVNLTDGLDGLAAGTVLPPLVVLAWLAGRAGAAGVATVDVAVAAACHGFLFFKRHPAKVFMGDTGALTLGAVVAGSAILIGNHLLLLLIGGVFVVETLSVILQVAYFKMTRKRIFKMSPLHHHYELSGWPEHKITTRFWAAALVLALAGFAVGR